MIFVTVGMHPEGFERLVRAADEMATQTAEPVIIQRGATQYTPASARYFDFVDEADLKKQLLDARIVISHSGAGSILNVLQANKPLVVVPRLTCFREVCDDHQLELAQALAQQGRAVVVTEPSAETLQKALEQATQLTKATQMRSKLQTALGDWLKERATEQMPRRWHWLRHRRLGDSC
jgi:beta-1,4-N-acetylglucosaminyltransferase